MKITKLNENQELADLYKQIDSNMSQDLYDRAVKMSDEASTRVIRNNDKLLKQYNSEENIQKRKEQKEIDDYNNRLDTEKEKITDLDEVKKVFDSTRFKVDRDLQKDGLSSLADIYDKKMKLPQASKVLKKYKPNFIKSWADSFNWQAVGDRNEPFVQALNNPSLDAILNGDEFRWVKLYNILYDADDNYSKYAAEPNTLLCNGNLYKSDIDNREARKLIEIDFKDNGVHRDGFNKRMDRNAWSEIISDAKKLGVEVKDNSSDKLIKAIKNKEKELSSEEKIAAVKALNFKKDELRELSNKLENANNS